MATGDFMLTIYGLYSSRASRNIWLADELGVPFKLVPVIQQNRLKGSTPPGMIATRSPEFLGINPNGHVPAADLDGLVLHESLAINLALAKKHGGTLGAMTPAEEALMTMWTIWAAAEVEPHSILVLYHLAAWAEERRDPAIAKKAIEALRAPFAVLDKELAKTGFLVGGRFTVADINAAEVLRYAMPEKTLWEGAPNVSAWLKACQDRPAYKAMITKRNEELELLKPYI
jgi:glutathione S-transferase